MREEQTPRNKMKIHMMNLEEHLVQQRKRDIGIHRSVFARHSNTDTRWGGRRRQKLQQRT
jgi:hypothetical protein